MAIHAQSSCTLSTITDVEAVYTYYYLSDSTITVNEAPKDNTNVPGASTITVISDGENYVWTLTEPQLDIEDDVIQTAVGQLYYIECVKFSDGTYDWGPLMTSSTYAAAKAAYNLSSQALAQAQAANAATALLGGHFMYGGSIGSSTPAGARIIEQIKENNTDVSNNPSKWLHNVIIGSNGIELRYNEAIMAQLAANQSGNNTALKFYKPPTISGGTTTQGGLAMQLDTNGLSFYGSNQSTPDAQLTSTGLSITNGSIELANGTNAAIKISNSNFSRSINSINYNDLRMAIGNQFGVASDGTLYASNANISGIINATSGYIGNSTNKIIIGSTSTSPINSYIYSGNHNSLNSSANGFYIGTDGISIGSNFNYDGSALTVDGEVIVNESITAEKINASALVINNASNTSFNSTNLLRNTYAVVPPITIRARASFNITETVYNVNVSSWEANNATTIRGSGCTDTVPLIMGGSLETLVTSYVQPPEGEQFTFSVYIRNNHATNNIKVSSNWATPASSVTVTPGQLKKVVISAHATGAANLQINFITDAAGDEVDITLWHPQLEKGNVATGWNIAAEDQKGATGRNLLRGTAECNILNGSNNWSNAAFFRSNCSATDLTEVQPNYELSKDNLVSPVAGITKCFKIIPDTVNVNRGFAQDAVPLNKGWYTVSAWVKGATNDVVTLRTYLYSSAERNLGNTKSITLTSDDWTFISWTAYNPTQTNVSAGYFYANVKTVGHVLYVTGMKLEQGCTPTAWLPAIEDTDTAIYNGQNLLAGSIDNNALNIDYAGPDFNFTEALEVNTCVYITANITVTAGIKAIAFYHSGNSIYFRNVGTVYRNENTSAAWTPVIEGTQTVTFAAKVESGMDTQTSGLGYGYLRLYKSSNLTGGASGLTGGVRVNWIKVEKGFRPFSWNDVAISSYITTIDNTGIKVHAANDLTDYIQINSASTSIWRNNNKMMELTDSALQFYKSNDSTHPLVSYGNSIIFYQPGTNTQAAEINGSGINIKTGSITLGSNFAVTSTGVLTAANVDISGIINATSGYIGNSTNKITIGSTLTSPINSYIYSGSHSTLNSTNSGFYIGTDGLSIGSKFKYVGGTTETLVVDNITANNLTINSGSLDASTVNISNLFIGGTNLLRDTTFMGTWSIGSAASVSNGEALLTGSSSNYNGYIKTSKMSKDVFDGVTPYIWSFEYMTTEACTAILSVDGTSGTVDDNSWARKKYHEFDPPTIFPNTNGKWVKYEIDSRTYSISDLTTNASEGEINSVNFTIFNRTSSGAILHIRHVQFEKGKISTSWSPAPEDYSTGGRNYWCALDEKIRSIGKNLVSYDYDGNGTYELTCTATSTTGYAQIYTSAWIKCPELAGKRVVFHADSIVASNNTVDERIYFSTRNSSGTGTGSFYINADQLCKTVLLPATMTEIQLIIRMDQNRQSAIGDTLTVVRPMLELGCIPSNWESASDDMSAVATKYITAIDNNNGIRVHAANNPTSNYAKIDASGMEVYKGGNPVAKFGQTIELSDGITTLYKVQPLGDASKLTRVYNTTLTDTVEGLTDTIYFGRAVSSWPTNAVTVYYKIFNSNTLTFTTGSKSYTPTGITPGTIIGDYNFKYNFSAYLSTNASSIELSFNEGETLAETESIIIERVVINFNTTQTTMESTLGAYPDTTQSAVFRIGSGISEGQESNALSIDWGGNMFLNGDIYVNCNNDSTGGISLGTVRQIVSAYNYENESGTIHLDIGVYQIGMLVLLDIECWKDSSIAAGSEIFNVDISKTEIPVPEGYYFSGMMFYNNRPLGIRILEGESEGDAGIRFRIRNCSTSAVTVSSSNDGARGNLMYISSGQTCAEYYYEHLM